MKKTILIITLLFGMVSYSQNQFTKSFEKSEKSWKILIGVSEFETAIANIGKIQSEPIEIDKEKSKLILTVQKKSIKWHKFRQRAVLRRKIQNL